MLSSGRPLFRAVLAALVLLCGAVAAHAQQCNPADGPQISAPPEACPYRPVDASVAPPATGSWDTLFWSITNGTFVDENGWVIEHPTTAAVRFNPNGMGPVTLTVAAERSGCSYSSSAQVDIRTIPEPQISAPPEVCPYRPAEASILPPAEGSWSIVSWSITNGGFVDADGNPVYYPNGETVRFYGNGNGPVTLYAFAEDSFGCSTSEQGSAQVQIRTIPEPQISAPPEVCPYRTAQASVLPPAEGSWAIVSWSITNGGFRDANGNPVQYPNGETVYFYGTGEGPVTLFAYAEDSFGCQTSEQGSAQVQIRTIPEPQISAPPEVCPYRTAQASVLPPAEGSWAIVSWSITNGGFRDANGNPVMYPSGETVYFYGTGEGPVTLFAYAEDSFGCQTSEQGSAQVQIRTIPEPQISAPPEVCPYRTAQASVLPPAEGSWSIVSWSITNGGFRDADGNPVQYPNGETVYFYGTGEGPVTLYAYAEDSFGCQTSEQGSAQVQIRTVSGPQISAPPQVCTYSPATASVLPPADGTWEIVSWSITNGGFLDASGNPVMNPTGQTVRFYASSTAEPVTLFAYGEDSFGCSEQGTITIPTVPGDTGTPPSITLSSPDVCGTEPITASVADQYASYAWEVTNAAITAGQGTSAITFVANGAGPVTVSVTTNAEACSSMDSETLPLRVTEPASMWAPASACPGGLLKAHTPYWYSGFSWTATNATIEGPADQETVQFRATGAGPVVLSLRALDSNGCFISNSATIPLDGYPVPNIGTPQGDSVCEGSQLGIQADDFYASYSWQVTNATIIEGQGTPFITFQHTPGAGAVVATLNVSDGACSASATKTITVRPIPEILAALASPSVCQTGTGTFYVDNYTSFSGVSVSLTNGTITNIGPGRVPGGRTYTYQHQGSGNTRIHIYVYKDTCAKVMDLEATMLPAATATITAGGPTTFCQGGSVTLTANDGVSYLWSTGATTKSINVSASGSYTVTVTNADGCSKTSAPAAVTVHAEPEIPYITANGPTTFCQGGSVTLSAPAGYSSYLWANGATTQSITVYSSSGNWVTVTDANGCTRVSPAVSVTVTEPVTPVITASTRFPCPGQSVTLTSSEAVSYVWSTGETTRTITVTPASSTSYSVQTTDANGCVRSASVSIFPGQPAKPTVTQSGSGTYCDGQVVTLTAMEYFPAHTYLWSTGETTRSIQAPVGATYTVQAINPHGCPSAPSDPVSLPTSAPTATVTGSTGICPGGSAPLQVELTGQAPWRIVWSDGLIQTGISTSPHVRYVVPSETTTYTLTSVKDALCTGTSEGAAVVTVNPLPSVTVTASGPTTFCEGGSVTLTASEHASYLWSNGATTRSITVSEPGSYKVTAWNEHGCGFQSPQTNVVVNANPATPVVTASGPTTFCEGGSVTLTAPSSASYLWSNGATTQSITVSASGGYSVTVTNASGCSAASAATNVVVNPSPATPVVTASGPTTFCEGGSVTLTAPSSASYLWSNGATTQSITVSASGAYSVTVTNASGCSAASAATSVVVNANPEVPVVTASGPTAFCEGGSVTLTAPSSASYLWSTGATTQSITVSASGAYSVAVTNASGCSAASAATHVIVNPNPATPVVTASGPTTFCEGGSVTLTAPSSASYLWSTGATTQSITVSAAGSYSVTVANGSGCSATSAATNVAVNANPEVPVITASGPTTFCEGGSVTLTAPENASYLWSTGATTQSIIVSASGPYSVTVANASGCSATSAATNVVADAAPATPVITPSGPTTFCEGGSVTLTAPESASYLWSNGATTQSISVSAAGAYSVTVTNGSGCSAASAATNVVVNANPEVPVVTASGPTTFCEGGSVTLTAPSSASYLWSNGATTQSISVSAAGAYSVTVTNASGCSAASAATNVVVNANPEVPVVTASGPTTFCEGGSVTLTAPSSTSYLWSNGATTQSITVSAAGAYSVTVTNASGCSATSAATNVVVNPLPSATITPDGPTTFCDGGYVSLTAPDGFPSYLWSNGATTRSINVNASGTFTVTVTNSNGCSTTSAPVTVTENGPVKPVITPTEATICPGGSATLTSTEAASYLWSNGATTRSITVSPAANTFYTVTTTDTNGCSATSDRAWVWVDAQLKPEVTIYGDAPFCDGELVTLAAPGYAPERTYLWSTGETTRVIQASTPGTYTVTVTNPTGCSATSDPVVLTATVPTATVSGTAAVCEGSSTTVQADLTGTGPWNITWSDGVVQTGIAASPATRVVTPSTTTTYTITAFSDASCSGTVSGSATVTVNPAPAVDIIVSHFYDAPGTGQIVSDDGTTVEICGDVAVRLRPTVLNPANTYSWAFGQNGGHNGAILDVQANGTYTLTMTDAAGCSTTSSVTIHYNPLPAPPVITASGPTSFCPGGSVTLTAPAGFASYLWSNGATTQSITVSETGSYSVAVTNATGCTAYSASTAVTVETPPAKPEVTAYPSTTVCEGIAVTLTAPAGFTYLWSNGATTRSIDVFASGSYSVTVTDANGCSSATSDPVPVTVNPNPPYPVVTESGPRVFCEGGSVTLTAPESASYLWSNGATTQSITVSESGMFYVTVTNASGCSMVSEEKSVVVYPLPETPVIEALDPTTFCEGGSVTLTAPESNFYQWSNGATTRSIVVTASGSYTVTVTDGVGCSATSAPVVVTVEDSPEMPVVTASGPTTFCEGGSVTLTAPASSSYQWSNGATTQSITVSASGSYSVTVSNGSGCSATSASTAVTVNANPSTPVISASGSTTFCEGGSVTLTAPASASYLWSNGATTQSITVSASGSYGVTVTNASGCSATSAATAVTVNANPATPAITANGPTTFCEGGSVTLTAPASASYLWSNGATTQSITVNASGSYSVTVTNASGCSATSAATTVTVNANPATPAITADGPTTFCEGGSVTLTAPASASYLWSNGATTQSITVNASGSYSVTVTNGSGCSATSAATAVTVNDEPETPVITANGPTTFCEGGSVTLTAPAGASYLWSNGATTQSITVNASGSYSVTVSNSSGCSATSAATTVTVNANPSQPSITANGPTTFCEGGSVTLTAPLSASYLWSNGATTQSITANASGSYSVTVANASGCSSIASAPVVVTVNANPATPAITPSGPTTFCEGGSVILTAPSSASYLWSNGATTQSITVNASGSYSVTVSNGSGCTAASAPTTVTVNPLPAVPVITPSDSTNLCPNGSVTLTAPAGFTSYLWSNGATGPQITVGYDNPGNYSVTVTNANGCQRTSAPVNVVANPATAISTHPLSQTMPRNTTRQLAVVATGTATLQYQWYNGSSGNTSSPIAGATGSTYTAGPYNKKGTHQFWVRVTSTGCPASSANSNTATITVN